MRNLRELGHDDIIAYRSRAGQARSVQEELGVDLVFDLDEAFRKQVDLAVIANPTSLHVPMAIECVRRGSHVFVEKPLSDRLDEVDLLAAAVREQGVLATVGYNLRFHPLLERVRSLLQDGRLGTVYSVRAWAGQYLPDWHPGEDYRQSYVARRDLGGGVILTLSHELDYLYWLFGEVDGVVATASQPGGLEMATESLAEVTLTFRSGVIGQVHLDCLRRTPSRGLEIVGSEGTIRCDLHRSEGWLDTPDCGHPEPIQAPLADTNQTYRDEMSHFIDCISSGKEPAVPLADGIAVLKLALAVHRAAATGVRQACL